MNNGLPNFREKILIVDAEVNICHILETRLTISGYKVFIAKNGNEALISLKKNEPNLVILDIMLPKMDGYEVYNELKKYSTIPIIMLTALGDISDRIMGLEYGADDYMIKPFSPNELEARIRSVLRRTNQKNQIVNKQLLYIGNLIIDSHKKQILKNKKKIHLTETEFRLLETLIENPGKKLSRTYLLNRIWGYTPLRYLDIRIVDVHISRLRAKFENDPNNPDLILTARGIGYMFHDFPNVSN